MILVTGANGQLGQCFRQVADDRFIFAASADLDIADKVAVQHFFRQNPQIRWCINCAAYTAVDKAESEQQQAYAVNVTGTKNLAAACVGIGATLIHFSTDYVYHGTQNSPLRETDPVRPKSIYAKTKLAGEKAAFRVHPNGTMVIRTSWVYAAHGQNFVRTMLRLGQERPALNVVFDQIGSPTYAPDLVDAVLSIMEAVTSGKVSNTALTGIWHYSNEGVTSWYDFAHATMRIAGLPCIVRPIETTQYPTPAQRPPFSLLNKAKIKTAFEVDIPHWEDSLRKCLNQP